MRVASSTAVFFLLPFLLGMTGQIDPPLSEVYLLAGSTITIDGTSTVNSFSCSSSEIAGRGSIDPISGGLNIYAGSFDCGIRRMNQDFRSALSADQHEFITFTILDAELIEEADRDGRSIVQAEGILELAGVSRTITVTAGANRLGAGKVRLQGSHNLRMTSFEVTPPTRLLGMVRVHDDITVHFDLLADEG